MGRRRDEEADDEDFEADGSDEVEGDSDFEDLEEDYSFWDEEEEDEEEFGGRSKGSRKSHRGGSAEWDDDSDRDSW